MMSFTIKQCLQEGNVSEGLRKNHRFASITHLAHLGLPLFRRQLQSTHLQPSPNLIRYQERNVDFFYSTMRKDKEEDYSDLVGAVTAQRGASKWKVGAFLH